MTFFVHTLNENNHIIWNQDFDARTKGGLRNLVHAGLQKMINDPLYPTAEEMESCASAPPSDQLLPLEHRPAVKIQRPAIGMRETED